MKFTKQKLIRKNIRTTSHDVQSHLSSKNISIFYLIITILWIKSCFSLINLVIWKSKKTNYFTSVSTSTRDFLSWVSQCWQLVYYDHFYSQLDDRVFTVARCKKISKYQMRILLTYLLVTLVGPKGGLSSEGIFILTEMWQNNIT